MDANLLDLDCEFRRQNQEIQTRLPLRISCATGDVEKISSDYFGDSVNMSARLIKDTCRTIWFSLFIHGYDQTEILGKLSVDFPSKILRLSKVFVRF